MKYLIFFFGICLPINIYSQMVSLFGIGGHSKYNDMKYPNKGYGTSFQYCNLFAISADYYHIANHQKLASPGGFSHTKIIQNYFKFQVGAGTPMKLNVDEFTYYGSIKWGFLTGIDKMLKYHEYTDGTISYGNEKSTGVYKAMRSLVGVWSFEGGIAFKSPIGLQFGIDIVSKKKRDLFEFWDQNSIKNSYIAVNNGTGSSPDEYAGFNNIHGVNIKLGLLIIIR